VGETWTGKSAAGKPVRVTAERYDYPGAGVLYSVAYNVRADGSARPVRYTPSWDRARALLLWFLTDITDPAVLAGTSSGVLNGRTETPSGPINGRAS
jgi:hypothetical protein